MKALFTGFYLLYRLSPCSKYSLRYERQSSVLGGQARREDEPARPTRGRGRPPPAVPQPHGLPAPPHLPYSLLPPGVLVRHGAGPSHPTCLARRQPPHGKLDGARGGGSGGRSAGGRHPDQASGQPVAACAPLGEQAPPPAAAILHSFGRAGFSGARSPNFMAQWRRNPGGDGHEFLQSA